MSFTTHRRLLVPIAAAGVIGLGLVGCTPGTGTDVADVDCAPYESYGTFEGETVEIYATIVDIEADQLVESWADFETCTGITIDYVGTQEAETQINVRAAAGDAPDIMIIPQPGLLQRLIADGYVVPAAQSVEDNVDEFWSESWKGYGTVDGTFYAAPLMASVKGWIWYSPADFEANGYEVPETWDDLMALTETMAGNNSATYKPWCVGFGSGDATGWPGTDWVEDLVLRTAGPEVYDQWVAGEVKFSDPKIKAAFDMVGDILLNPDYRQRRIRRRRVDRLDHVQRRRPADPRRELLPAPPGLVLRGTVAGGHRRRSRWRHLGLHHAEDRRRTRVTRSPAAASSSQRSSSPTPSPRCRRTCRATPGPTTASPSVA